MIYDENAPDTEEDEDEEPQEPKNPYGTVPYEKRPEEELYSYRDALDAPKQAQQRKPAAINAAGYAEAAEPAPAGLKKRQVLLAIVTFGVIILAIFGVMNVQQGTPPPYVDLGTSQVANSGLSGDLVMRWTGKASYLFYVNPLSADDVAGFAAVAANPPRQVVFTIHLKDASGVTICGKEIVFPYKAPENGSAIPTQGPAERSMDGDAISYERGDQGEIVRIEMNGPISCSQKFYQNIAAWDFTSTYPVRGDQNDWGKNVEKELGKKQAPKAKKTAPVVRVLTGPTEGDDVVVGDNPSHGTVLTRGGHEFYVGPGGLSSHGEGWGFFPAAIHYHCDVKANCTLTSSGTTSTVYARMMK